MSIVAMQQKRNPIARVIVYLVATVLFSDIAFGNYQDGKSWWKGALAAALFAIAALLYFRRYLHSRTSTESH